MKIVIFISILFWGQLLFSQTITGFSGLLTIPTADVLDDSEFSFGISTYPKEYLKIFDYKYDALIFYSYGSFLPNFELGLRTTYAPKMKNNAIGDRMPILRFQIVREGLIFPSVLVGVHDFLTVFGGNGAIHYNSLYLVLTKSIKYDEYIINELKFTIGYGSDAIKAAGHEFVGVFGGFSLKIANHLLILLEHNGQFQNIGIKYTLFNQIHLLAGLIESKKITIGLSYLFVL